MKTHRVMSVQIPKQLTGQEMNELLDQEVRTTFKEEEHSLGRIIEVWTEINENGIWLKMTLEAEV